MDADNMVCRRRSRGLLTQLPRVVAVLSLAVLLTGCQVAKSAFGDEADTVSGNFAAAATTLRYLHEGKLTRQYARAAFFNYAAVTKDANAPLASASGAPDPPALQRLLRLYQPAAQAIQDPCLDSGCDWQRQVSDLERASDALREAAQA